MRDDSVSLSSIRRDLEALRALFDDLRHNPDASAIPNYAAAVALYNNVTEKAKRVEDGPNVGSLSQVYFQEKMLGFIEFYGRALLGKDNEADKWLVIALGDLTIALGALPKEE
jgi:hypothetical protein